MPIFMDTPDATAAEKWLAAIVESSDDAIVSKTLEGRISTWNEAAERLFGYTGLEAMGQPIAMLAPEGRRNEMHRILDRIRNGERVEAYVTQRRHRDGRIVDILLRVSPIRDGDGRVIGASKIALDISDRRAAERQQRQLKNELNHRVKNTLMIVQSLVGRTLRGSPDLGARPSNEFSGCLERRSLSRRTRRRHAHRPALASLRRLWAVQIIAHSPRT